MQKDYVILTHDNNNLVMLSIHSHLYPEYLQLGYTVIFNGSKKSCMAYMEGESELAA